MELLEIIFLVKRKEKKKQTDLSLDIHLMPLRAESTWNENVCFDLFSKPYVF